MSDTGAALFQVGLLVALLAVTVPFLGRYLAAVYTSPRHLAVERAAYRVLRLDPDADQHWRSYLTSVLGFSLVGVLVLFGFGRLQQHLPLSIGMPALPSDGAWNTAVSFVTNTNWQWYSGEAATGHLFQMSGLTVQNFVSAAVGMAVAAAFARGLAAVRERRPGRQLLGGPGPRRRPGAAADLPGRPRCSSSSSARSRTSTHRRRSRPSPATPSTSPVDRWRARRRSRSSAPTAVASTTSTPRTRSRTPPPCRNLLEIYLILLIPFAMAFAFGRIVRDRRQGYAVAAVMAILLGASIALLTWAELAGPGSAPARSRRGDGGQGGPLRTRHPARCSPRPRPARRPVP